MVRPESVSLRATQHNPDGTVVTSVFRGATADYEVETAAGTLIASVPGPDPTSVLAAGTKVAVDIDQRRSYLLPKP